MEERDTTIQIADAGGQVPTADPDNAFAREQSDLRRAAHPSSAQIGSVLPDAALLAADGTSTSIAAARDGGPAVVVLYRGAWCPYCNTALRKYRNELAPALRERGTKLIAVSPQHPDGSLTMQEKHDLDFPVLSDPGNQIARALGVLTRPAEYAHDLEAEHGLDLTAVNADGTIELPMPTVAIIDAAGVLRWIDVHPDYTTRTEPAAVLRAVEELSL
ncbi:peroxiredoxin-like family protein [Agromyces bauzanensis]|uniref:thioredoxin-dependent peroxiredoxin n=1 Tax=Agromyces bauzanensis TaxID=1308924 RepID=A0A917PS04_9MICO|nr:peroxiredoxin-like family protein [Agromyces bauzanensis]GGJ88899.1 peroxiredoxin [Agromyces bauzanensis]